MESRNYYNKLITIIELDNGTIVIDPKFILTETQTFF